MIDGQIREFSKLQINPISRITAPANDPRIQLRDPNQCLLSGERSLNPTFATADYRNEYLSFRQKNSNGLKRIEFLLNVHSSEDEPIYDVA